MAATPKRVYWDACAWIAVIQDEKVKLSDGSLENRAAMGRAVIADATKGKAEIFTSAFCLIEVCKNKDLKAGKNDEKIAAFFENDYIVIVNVDRYTGETGRKLMLSGISKLKPADASHLAAATVINADEMHTFDDRLLDLDGVLDKADGTKLRICKPSMGGPGLPLWDSSATEKKH